MQVTFYGTGSGIPTPKSLNKPLRSYAGWYIEAGSDSLLFDIGVGSNHKMLLSGIDLLLNPTHVFLTHHHLDHTSDIFQLIIGRSHALKYRKDKVNKLVVAAPTSFVKILQSMLKIYGGTEFQVEENFEIKDSSNNFIYKTDKFEVTSSPIKHTEDSVCYKLKMGNKSIVYSGDMGYDERIAELGRDADLAILECSYPNKESLTGNHLCPDDIGKLAKLGNFKKVVLTHMFPDCEGREDEIIRTIKNIADVDVIVGYDLLKLEI